MNQTVGSLGATSRPRAYTSTDARPNKLYGGYSDEPQVVFHDDPEAVPTKQAGGTPVVANGSSRMG